MCQYEATSMATFKHGRTETIRPATQEAAICVKSYQNFKANPADTAAKVELEKSLRVAMAAHNKVRLYEYLCKNDICCVCL